MKYEININKIKSQRNYLQTCYRVLVEIKCPINDIQQFATMRALHIGVECIIDIGNTIIDSFIMRDPGGYLDIIDILEDERVIPAELATKIKHFVKFREKLVRSYDQIESRALAELLPNVEIFPQFISYVETFITKEETAGNISFQTS